MTPTVDELEREIGDLARKLLSNRNEALTPLLRKTADLAARAREAEAAQEDWRGGLWRQRQ